MIKVDDKFAEQLKPSSRQLMKDDILFNGYRLEISETCNGIPVEEITELKLFLRDIASVLPTLLRNVDNLSKALQEGKNLDESTAGEALGPGIYLWKYLTNDVIYRVMVVWDHVVFLDRGEDLYQPSGSDGGLVHTQYEVWRNIGEISPVSTTA
jgi:hypothetical protein